MLAHVDNDLDGRVVATEPADAPDDEGMRKGREGGLHVQEDRGRGGGTMHHQREVPDLDVHDVVDAEPALDKSALPLVDVVREGIGQVGVAKGR